MKDLFIRTYESKDESQVIDLWRECGLVVPWNNPAKDIKRKTDDSPDLFFVGEREGKIVASCMSGYDGHRGWIYYLGVTPALRHQGIASRMLGYAEKRLKEMGCPKVDLMVRKTNTSVLSFYESSGYSQDQVMVLSRRLGKPDK